MQGFLLYKRTKSRTDEPKLSLSCSSLISLGVPNFWRSCFLPFAIGLMPITLPDLCKVLQLTSLLYVCYYAINRKP